MTNDDYRQGRDRLRFMELFLFDCGYPAMNSYVRFLDERRNLFARCSRRKCKASSKGSGFCDYHYQFALIRVYFWMKAVTWLRPSICATKEIKTDYSQTQIDGWMQ